MIRTQLLQGYGDGYYMHNIQMHVAPAYVDYQILR